MNSNIAVPGASSHKRAHGHTRSENNPPRQFLAHPTVPTSEDDTQPVRKKRSSTRGIVPRNPAVGHSGAMDVSMDVKTHRAPRSRSSLSRQPLASVSERPLPELPNTRKTRSKKEKEKEPVGGAIGGRRMSEPITVTDDEDEDGGSARSVGIPTSAEISRLRAELSEARKLLAAKDKLIDDRDKVAAKVRRDLQTVTKEAKSRRLELDKLHAKSKELNELVLSIEETLHCQICMSMLVKPFALSPCGHVLCQDCLQHWFRQAPIDPYDMDTDENALPLIRRKKICPVCRTRVRSRPLQLFVLKSLLSTLAKARDANARQPSPPPVLADPWKGIFAEPGESNSEDDDDDDEESDGDEDEDDDEDESSDDDADMGLLDVYDDSSDDEYEGEWTEPSWEPPANRYAAPLHPDRLIDTMLRRGATLDMIETYDMEYSHEYGLSIRRGRMRMYLGYNIELADDDGDGSGLVEWCWEDVDARRERWNLDVIGRTASRLVRADAANVWDNTDSEAYIEGIADYEDEDEEESD